MVILVNDLVEVAVGEDDGTIVFDALRTALSNHDMVTLSFAGIKTATTSFVNTAFVPLLDQMPFGDIKRRIQVVDSTRQINHMIKWRLETEAKAQTQVR
jgi:hypothetical protein